MRVHLNRLQPISEVIGITLYHYFDGSIGPFVNLSDIPLEEAKAVLRSIKESKPNSQSAARDPEYVEHRRNCERMLRAAFAEKCGVIQRESPHYMVVEHSPWLSTWFENGAFVRIPIEEFDLRTVSFTYGDSMPTFSNRINDNKEYRKRVYTYDEILTLIAKYGLPQDWNGDGRHGPERYIEAHIWSDETISKYR